MKTVTSSVRFPFPSPLDRWTSLVIILVCCGMAASSVLAEAVKPAVPILAHPLPLSAVRVTGGPLKVAMDQDIKTLLALEPDRMMFFLRQRAGLQPKAANGYGGWDGGNGKQLTGHIAGHYLSAVSFMYAATGDPRFKERVDYLVNELAEVQNKYGDGYIGALTDAQGTPGKQIFQQVAQGNIRSGGFDLNGLWSPWYVEHKLFAGLRDAYRYAGNKKALEVETRFAAWTESIVGHLSEAQLQGQPGVNGGRRIPGMLDTEFGGMNDVLADLYADTGNPRWLKVSDCFEHKSIVDPLAQKHDILGGKHGNTQVPKLIGELTRYIYTRNQVDGAAAKFFWDAVVNHHSFATGGHGYDEYFGAPDKLSGQVDGTGQRSQDLRTCESCNVYNMIKMTRTMFSLDPNDRYPEFHERALFNHILASINPNDGEVCYMVPIGQGVQHEYQGQIANSYFTCCVGSGLESHALHGDGIYYENGDKLWVNLYVPTTAEWKSQGVNLVMDTSFPIGDAATLKLTMPAPKQLTLAMRRPEWAGEGFSVKVNGEAVTALPKPGSFVELKRTWKTGDTVALVLPKKLHIEPLVDNTNRVAFMWGPLVLAGDMGPRRQGGGGGGRNRNGASTPSFAAFADGGQPLDKWFKEMSGKPDTFHARTVNGNSDLTFVPFYELPGRRYGIYWDVFTPQEWAEKSPGYLEQLEKRRRLEAATVAYAQPGEMQPETDFNYQGEDSSPVRVAEQPGRHGSKWFSFDLPVEQTHPLALVVTYNSSESAKRTFDILVDGQKLKDETIEGSTPAKFYDLEYKLPTALLAGKSKVTVKFEATGGNEIAAVFGLRVVRTDMPR